MEKKIFFGGNTKDMNKLKLWFIIYLTITSLAPIYTMQPQVTITDMPPDVIQHIAGYIPFDRINVICGHSRDLNALTSTCRYLHATATRKNQTVYMRCGHDIRTPLKDFLDQIFICIQHIIARNGNNKIYLDLSDNYLVRNISAFSTFLAQCSQPQITRHITGLSLNGNCLLHLPKEIAGLTYLQKLDLSYNNDLILAKEIAGLVNLKELKLNNNKLKKEALVLLEKIINESLPRLETVNISANYSLRPWDVYRTIAHCALKNIYALNSAAYHPTPEEIAACKTGEIVLV